MQILDHSDFDSIANKANQCIQVSKLDISRARACGLSSRLGLSANFKDRDLVVEATQ